MRIPVTDLKLAYKQGSKLIAPLRPKFVESAETLKFKYAPLQGDFADFSRAAQNADSANTAEYFNFLKTMFNYKSFKNEEKLAKLLKKVPYSENHAGYTRVATSYNENNSILLDTFLDNPSRLQEIKDGQLKDISFNKLSILMMLNRNQKNATKYVGNPHEVKNFFDRINHFIKEEAYSHAQKSEYPSSVKDFVKVLSEGELFSQKGVKARFNNNVLNDLENYIHEKPYYPQFRKGESAEKILKETATGDAVSVGDKMYFNNGSSLEKLQLSVEDYETLFPPIDRYYPVQGRIGDCYLVEALNGIMQDAKGRGDIYRSFKSTENGIVVKLQGAEDSFPYHFRRFDDQRLHIHNKNGLAVLEQAFAHYETRGERTLTEMMHDIEYGAPMPVMRAIQKTYKNFDDVYLLEMSEENIKKMLSNLIRRDKNMVFTGSLKTIEPTFPRSHAVRIQDYDRETNMLTYAQPGYGGLLFDTPLDKRFFKMNWAGLDVFKR